MPRKPIRMPDLETLEGLARLGVTQEELADLCSCSQPTISAKLAREPYASIWRRGQAELRVSTRRRLIRLADEGSVAAAIFLSKAILRMQEPPRESHVEADVRNNVAIVYEARWGGRSGKHWDEVGPGDTAEVIEGEADEE